MFKKLCECVKKTFAQTLIKKKTKLVFSKRFVIVFPKTLAPALTHIN